MGNDDGDDGGRDGWRRRGGRGFTHLLADLLTRWKAVSTGLNTLYSQLFQIPGG